MNKKQWKGEAETLRLILDSYNQTLPELHQKMYDARIEIKELTASNKFIEQAYNNALAGMPNYTGSATGLVEEIARLKLIVKEKDNVIENLQRLNTAGKAHVLQLENRELELLSEINDLKSMLSEAKVVINDLEKRNEELEQVPTISRYTDNH